MSQTDTFTAFLLGLKWSLAVNDKAIRQEKHLALAVLGLTVIHNIT